MLRARRSHCIRKGADGESPGRRPCEYVTVLAQDGREYSLTLAGAANLLGYVPDGDYARGHDTPTALPGRPWALTQASPPRRPPGR